MQQSEASNKYELCLENIKSLEAFYRLSSHQQLVSVALNREQSRALKIPERLRLSEALRRIFQPKEHNRVLSQQAQVFSEKYSYEKLCDKYAKPKGSSDFFNKILRRKLKKQPIQSAETRKRVWLIASGAQFYLASKHNQSQKLYEHLWRYEPYPECFDRTIAMDLRRTKTHSGIISQQKKETMGRILRAYSRRNPYIGYCQGMNYVVGFMLEMGFQEEECFWMLVQVLETIIPIDYYTNMTGLVTDQNIFCEILRQTRPKVSQKLKEVGLTTQVFTIQWFVCLFSNSLPKKMVEIVWDHLMAYGVSALIKTALIIMDLFQEKIVAATEFPHIIWIVEEGCRSLKMTDQEYQVCFEKIYISRSTLKVAHQLYREMIVSERLSDRMRYSPKLTQEDKCDRSWPICLWMVERYLKHKEDPQVWTIKSNNPPNFIAEYMEQLQTKKTASIEYYRGLSQIEDDNDALIMGRMTHICTVNEPSPQEFHLEELQFQMNEQPPAQLEKESPIQHSNTLSRILEAESSDEDTEPERSCSHSTKHNLDPQATATSSGKKMPVTALDILKKSSSVQFYRKFLRSNRELCAVMKERQQQ